MILRGLFTLGLLGVALTSSAPLASGTVASWPTTHHAVSNDLSRFGVLFSPNRVQPARTSTATRTILRSFLSQSPMIDHVVLTSPRLRASFGKFVTNKFPGSHATGVEKGWLVSETHAPLAYYGHPVGEKMGPTSAASCTTWGVFNATTGHWRSWMASCD